MATRKELSDELADSRELVISEALSDPSLGRRVTVRDGQAMTTDGPSCTARGSASRTGRRPSRKPVEPRWPQAG